ncbi:fumarylacetoacetase [Pseudonocardia sulfidoxydans NBRC 16205]|uniref:Fumarylacetoacetase n=1 Tax=Pseudonocardia sulfidoxydans NBRC 16205 TaxID=1223511 RepID=A0A511DLL1_9PSEU|nr:fumarylacetoacetate hydrolase family protein [Pseudonocardia sulfidoxydans]GEL25277.1 fumarylacetoacetase [Pseudonocardia sulfidoxydans NBRC 16205]
MRLVTYRPPGDAEPRVGALDGERVVDLPGFTSMLDLLERGPTGLDDARTLASLAATTHPLADVTLLAPLPRPRTMRDFMLVEEHVRNSFGDVPEEWFRIPVHWKCNPDTVIGPDAVAPWPYYTDKLDYELEVAAVIGAPLFRATVEQAEAAVAGYTIFNDWSARDIQFREMSVGIGPAFGKDFATSLGPCLTTADSFDATGARMSARINGETWSEGSIGAMRFSFGQAVATLSQYQPLHPGDVIGGGTTGRGCGLEIDRWLSPGDVVELEVEGIGVLRNTVGRKDDDPPADSGINLVKPEEFP